VVIAVVLGAAWAGMSVRLVLRARDSASAARVLLEDLAVQDPLELDVDATRAEVDGARAHLSAARQDLDSPVLWPLRPLPFIGRQLASGRALSSTSSELTDRVEGLLATMTAARSEGSTPGARMTVLEGLENDLVGLQSIVAAPDLGPGDGLTGSLADARIELSRHLGTLADSVDDGLVLVRGLRAFLADSDYVVLGAQNASMATAGPRYLTVSEMSTWQGTLQLQDLRVSRFSPPPAGVSILDPDIQALWGSGAPTADFRQLNVSPRFEQFTAPQALAMWQASTGQRHGVRRDGPPRLRVPGSVRRVPGPLGGRTASSPRGRDRTPGPHRTEREGVGSTRARACPSPCSRASQPARVQQ
jgi:outer membrane murein-binding lipoprotein Lpp